MTKLSRSFSLMSILLAPGVIITLIAALVFSAVLISSKYQTTQAQLILEQQTIQALFSKSIEQDVLLGQQPSVYQGCKALFDSEKFVSIRVEGKNGFLFCDISQKNAKAYWQSSRSTKIQFGPDGETAANVTTGFNLEPLRGQMVEYSLFSLGLSLVIVFFHFGLYFFLGRFVGKPLIEVADLLEEGDLGKISNYSSDYTGGKRVLEITTLGLKVKEFAKNLLIYQTRAIDEAKEKERFKLARQVAHDIQSPLMALRIISQGSSSDEPRNSLLMKTIERISEISSDLLENNTSYRIRSDSKTTLKELIEEIIAEKNIQNKDVEFKFDTASFKYSKGLPSVVEESDLKRIISNLIQNAIEASVDPKMVEVGFQEDEQRNVIYIKDYGKGIPSEVLSRLGEEEFSYGKEATSSGFGLGVYGAKKVVARWGGELVFESRVNEGTRVSVILPCMAQPGL